MSENMKVKTEKILAVMLLLVLWQAAAMAMNSKILLASPVSVVVRLFSLWREKDFFQVIAFTMVRIMTGFLLGLTAGCLLAVLAGKFSLVEILLSPVMVTIRSVPVASFIIIALVWLSGRRLSSFISFLMVLPVVYNNVLGGIKSIDRQMIEMADVFHLSFGKRFKYIWLSTIKTPLLTAVSTSLGLAWKSGVAAEIIGIPDGSVGEKLYYAKIYLDTVDLFAWTVVIVAASVLFEKIFLLILKWLYGRLER